MASNKVEIVIEGRDRASGPLSRVSGALGNMASIAGGIIAANVFGKIADGVAGMARDAVNAAGQMQTLGIAFEGLIAREIARGEEVTKTRTKVLSLTDAERQKLKDLQLDYDTLTARVQEQKQKVWEMTNVWTEQGLATQTAKARLAEMVNEQGKLSNKIDELASKEGKLVKVSEKVRINTMDIGDAMGLAAPKAEELLQQIRELSIISPFEYETVVNTTRLQMAFGATTDEAIPLTKAILDTAAGLGLTSEEADRLAYNFGQIRSVGQIMGADMRQLRMVGLDLADVFESQLGMSVEEVNKKLKAGKLTMEDVSEAFVQYAEENFGGAAERMSRTFDGLKSSIKDVAFFAGADLLGPALEVVSDALGGLFDNVRKILDSGVLREIGQAIGGILSAALAGDIGGTFDALAEGLAGLGVPPGVIDFFRNAGVEIEGFVEKVGEFISTVADTTWQATLAWFDENGPALSESLKGIGAAFGDVVTAVLRLFGADGAVSQIDTEGLGVIVEGFWNEVQKFFQDMEEWLNTTADNIEWFADIWPGLVDAVGEALGMLEDEARKNLAKFFLVFLGVIADLRQWWEGLNPEFEKMGRGLVEGIKQGIENAWDAFIKWLLRQVGGILDAVKEYLGLESPAKATMPIGEGMVEGLQVGWARAFGGFQSDVTGSMAGLSFGGMGAMAPAGAVAGSAGGTARPGGDTYYITVNDRAAAALLLGEINERRRQRLDGFMGA